MKVSIFISFVILIIPVLVKGQGGVVSAPVLESIASGQSAVMQSQVAITTTMSGVIQSLEEAESKFKAAMEKATWMRSLNSARRLVFMVENLVCTTKDINVKIGLADSHSSCLINYKFDISVAKLEMCVEYLGILLTDGVSMTNAERMDVMSTTQEKFEESQDEFVKLNRELDVQVRTKKIQRNMYDGMRFLTIPKIVR